MFKMSPIKKARKGCKNKKNYKEKTFRKMKVSNTKTKNLTKKNSGNKRRKKGGKRWL